MLRAAVGVWIFSAVIFVARGDHHDHHADHHDDHHDHQDTALDGAGSSSVSLVSSANKQFAFRLYQKLAARADSEGKNTFFSPVSVSVALAALSVGARGQTHQQLYSGLGFNNSMLTQADIDQAFSALLRKDNATSQEDTSEGTAVFIDDSFKPRPEFLETLKTSYLADGFNVDFGQSESANFINKYVEEKTHGKITDLVESLDPNTVMYLISYIHYKGTWQNTFDPFLTKADTFMVDENTKVPVQMMNMEKNVETYYDRAINTSVLHLPFNSSYSMLLLLPDDMATLESTICPAHVTKWMKWKKSRTLDVYIPKFSIKTSYQLKDVLTEMGMTDMFGDQADLGGISEGQKLSVSDVVHKATLDVNEAGATAAAATGIGITLLSLRQISVLKFDRPFMVVITERDTENILFMGKILNPNI